MAYKEGEVEKQGNGSELSEVSYGGSAREYKPFQ